MIYLVIDQAYEGLTIIGASFSEEGAKRLLEEYAYGDDVIRFEPIPDKWVERGRPEMQEYCRRVGRPIWCLAGQPDKQVVVIEQVEE